ncbi:gas vesicle protein [Desulfosporosinus fructosivorans]|uniref:gas vesicle protein n=1 Tax=Desulfosporosinus fructosivorans TaxID=2018669 RepID=UPI0018EE51E7|nr:gas vesicle protein [Desulfosporosinus fructosivorans]
MGDIANSKQVTLLEVVEKLLDKGVVISGDLILSCGNVDLVYLNLKIVLTSVQTMLEGNTLKKDVTL